VESPADRGADDRGTDMRRLSVIAIFGLLIGVLAAISSAGPAFASNNGDSSTDLSACSEPVMFPQCHTYPVTTHYGQAINMTITVDDNSDSCNNVGACDPPHGTVELHDGDPNATPALASRALDSFTNKSSSTFFDFAALAPGHHELTARYISIPGDAGFNNSVTLVSRAVDVSRDGTSTSLSQSTTTNVVGNGPDLTATVTPTDAPDTADGAVKPGGQVQFVDGGVVLGTSPLDSNTGQATFHAIELDAGPHNLWATYVGDTNYLGNTSATISHSVTQGATTDTLMSSATTVVFGQAYSVTATVAPVSPATGIPSGIVGVTDSFDGLTETAPLIGGARTFDFPNGGLGQAVGVHQFSSSYEGDDNFIGSDSNIVSVTVNKANTTTSVTSSGSPSTLGQAVTFTAAVAVVAPGGGPLTGTVRFKDGASNLGVAQPLVGGAASVTTSALAGGAHVITAVYSGDLNFNGSTGTVSQTVTCDRIITGFQTSVTASPTGTTCLIGADVRNLTVPAGAKLSLINSTVRGTITARGGAGSVVICGTHVGGNIRISGANGFLLIGDAVRGCAANTIDGTVTLSKNTGGLQLGFNDIGGRVSVTRNVGAGPEIEANTIGGSLACSANSPVASDGGQSNAVHGRRTGECGAPGF